MSQPLVVPARYCGPPHSANGGYFAGSVAGLLLGGHDEDRLGRAVQVTVRQPPPLDAPMTFTADDDTHATVTFGGAVIGQAETTEDDVEPVEPVPYDEALDASATYAGLRDHPFPTCFSCGTDRDDGLRIHPGPVDAPATDETGAGHPLVAAPWTPDVSLSADFHGYDDPTRRTCLAAAWSALDCVGGWSCNLGGRPIVLGRMTAVIDALPVVGEPHVATGLWLGADGRRSRTCSTLHDSDGRIVGRARHVWFTVDPELFGGTPAHT